MKYTRAVAGLIALSIFTPWSALADECDSALVQTILLTHSSNDAATALLDIVNSSNFEELKKSASAQGDYGQIISASGNWQDFQTRRSQYFSLHNYTSKESHAFDNLVQFVPPEGYRAWEKCINKYGLSIVSVASAGAQATFQVVWRPTYRLQPSKVTGSFLSNGSVEGVAGHKIFPNGYQLGSTDAFIVKRTPNGNGSFDTLSGWLQVDQSVTEHFILSATPPPPNPLANTGVSYRFTLNSGGVRLNLVATGNSQSPIRTRRILVDDQDVPEVDDVPIFLVEIAAHDEHVHPVKAKIGYYVRSVNGDPFIGSNMINGTIRLETPDAATKIYFEPIASDDSVREGEGFLLNEGSVTSYFHVGSDGRSIVLGARNDAAEFQLVPVSGGGG